MATAITLWIIGWLFVWGVCKNGMDRDGDDPPAALTIASCTMLVFIWPVALGRAWASRSNRPVINIHRCQHSENP